MMKANILVIGKSGQLAVELARATSDLGASIQALGRNDIDLARPQATAERIRQLAPSVVINAAAYTAVDKAESEPDAAFRLNRDGPAELAAACAEIDAAFIQVSTDYVFDGSKPTPYLETDLKSPTSIYGKSKSEGEDAVLSSGARATVIRTSWLYASHGANFVRTMLRLAETRDEVAVVADQLGRPTWARDLAHACLTTALRLNSGDDAALGVFHYSGGGDATWADFAEEIFSCARSLGAKGANVKRITTAEYPTPAQRPANSRLDTSKIKTVLAIAPRPWREACAECVRELLA
jgi:dTDP-4-dehydrorhamnose reductase